MKLFSSTESYKLYHGNMLDMLTVIEPNSIDAIVTDPPYELNFMNKGWDNSGIAFQKETWERCFKVLKPGGHLLAFGGSRTFHRIACAIEDAGFEIRDTIMWLYGSGFPKSMNIGLAIDKKLGVESTVIGHSTNGTGAQPNKLNNHTHGDTGIGYADGSGREFDIKQAQNEWAGWGTQLKPAYEPIIVARKPCDGTCVDNVMKYGVGGINIDECRVPHSEPVETMHHHTDKGNNTTLHTYGDSETDCIASPNEQGRFPANVILTYDETDFDEVCGGMPDTKTGNLSPYQEKETTSEIYGFNSKPTFRDVVHIGDEGSAARYFYCAKASKRDRDEGLDAFETKYVAFSNQGKAELARGNVEFSGNKSSPLNGFNKVQSAKNTHPTVKPTALMSYLIRLVTPKGGTILDPFNGSGSTGKAAMYENKDRNAGYKYIGIELTSEYLPIADARIRFALGDNTPVEYSEVVSNNPTPKSVNSSGQISLFDENI